MSGTYSSINQRQSSELNKKSNTENVQKIFMQVTKTNPLPFIKKGIDVYINERKMKKKKKCLEIYDSQQKLNKSEPEIKRYDEIYQSIAEIYKRHDFKKRVLVSPNKILSHEKLLEVFQPYKKEIQKLRIRKNLSDWQSEESPFAMALKELGLFYDSDARSQNKVIPLKQLTSIYRSLPKKQFKQKLKPISEDNIKVGSQNRFLSVEKMNLLDSDQKTKQVIAFPSTSSNSTKVDLSISDSKKSIEDNFQRMQDFKKQRQYRMNPQLYIRKMYNSRNYNKDKIKQEQPESKRSEQSIKAIMKIYPSLRANLETKPVSNNGNISIVSYSKTTQSPEKSKHLSSQTHSFRLLEPYEQTENYAIGEDDDMEEGFYIDEGNKKIYNKNEKQEQPQIQQISINLPKQTSTNPNSPIKLQRRKKFFNSLPFQTYYYRDLIWKMNFTNAMFVETPLQYQHRLKAFVGRGNNSSMLIGLIKRRIWFAITDKIQQANFVWTQLKQLVYFNKQDSGKAIPVYKPSQEQQKPEYVKSGGIFNSKDHSQFKSYFETYINFEQKSDQRLLNRQKCFKYQQVVRSSQIRDQKLQNHLINNYVIGNKKALFNTMSNYYASINEDVFDYLPLTFHIKNGLEDDSWYKFLKYYYKRSKDIKKSNEEQNNSGKEYNSWIVKPGQNSNRGNGIQVCLTLDEIKNIIKKKEKYSDGSPKTYIVQSYIQKPLLYQKRKFDIRHYMMMTCINGKVKGYFYRDGYIRTTSSEYNLKTNCGKIHLTNDAVQKNLPDYGKYEKGNKISYDELQTYMSKNPKTRSFDFYGKIYPRMKKIATDVMKACSGGIDPEKLVNNFQVFGMDFMIDSNFNVWLIQVNSNPCLELSCPLLGSIIPRMVQNALELTVDCLFPPPVRYTPKGVHYYKNLEQQNRFELVYDERIDGLSTSSMDVLDGKMLYEEDDTFEDDGDQWKED